MNDLGYLGKLVCSLEVKDYKASAAWYRDVLGFEVSWENEEMGMCFIKTPVEGVHLDISQVEEPQTRGGATLVWSVKDIGSARQLLEERSVAFDGPTREFGGMVKLATFFDPDGNRLMLYESAGA
ncbi:MAG: VOC family protein [Fimbriimonadaceae bacterium]|nr:VOC family protein [Fimbriimonadaceae bacterium]